MVGLDRLELSTSPLSGVRSSHLSYRPATNTIIHPSQRTPEGEPMARAIPPVARGEGQALISMLRSSHLSYRPATHY